MTLRVLDLFSGIGGFSLGLERAGMKTVAFCEIEPYPRAVLRKHWPEVPIYHDVRELTGEKLRADGIVPDVICGGFPCQDISIAGRGAGLAGERSGLWREYARIIGEVRPRFVIVENVTALLSRGLGSLLRDLASLGYDAEWHCIPAAAVGAPHRRDRIWIVAYPEHARPPCNGSEQQSKSPLAVAIDGHPKEGRLDVADADHAERWPHTAPRRYVQRQNSLPQRQKGTGGFGPCREVLDYALRGRHSPQAKQVSAGRNGSFDTGWWSSEPDVGRVANGVPARVHRLRALGNAVVPQIPEIIGRAFLQAHSEMKLAA